MDGGLAHRHSWSPAMRHARDQVLRLAVRHSSIPWRLYILAHTSDPPVRIQAPAAVCLMAEGFVTMIDKGEMWSPNCIGVGKG